MVISSDKGTDHWTCSGVRPLDQRGDTGRGGPPRSVTTRGHRRPTPPGRPLPRLGAVTSTRPAGGSFRNWRRGATSSEVPLSTAAQAASERLPTLARSRRRAYGPDLASSSSATRCARLPMAAGAKRRACRPADRGQLLVVPGAVLQHGAYPAGQQGLGTGCELVWEATPRQNRRRGLWEAPQPTIGR